MVDIPQIVYLHGLGSSPDSAKARLVGDHYRSQGYQVHIPSLALPSLEKLSAREVVSYVRALIERVASTHELFVVGSSFGGFVATHAYASASQGGRSAVRGLVLMAPVFYPWHRTQGLLTPEVDRQWRERGSYPITESATGKNVSVHYEFVEELRLYDSDSVSLAVPTLIMHGTNDATVSHQQSVEFAARQPTVELMLSPDDHQLLAEPATLIERIDRFIKRNSKS